MPLTVSYAALVSSTETMASTSAAGVTPPSHLPPGMPAIEPMDMLLAPTTENLLTTAGVGQGRKPRPAPKPSATPSASQDHGDPAREVEGARGRSSF